MILRYGKFLPWNVARILGECIYCSKILKFVNFFSKNYSQDILKFFLMSKIAQKITKNYDKCKY